MDGWMDSLGGVCAGWSFHNLLKYPPSRKKKKSSWVKLWPSSRHAAHSHPWATSTDQIQACWLYYTPSAMSMICSADYVSHEFRKDLRWLFKDTTACRNHNHRFYSCVNHLNAGPRLSTFNLNTVIQTKRDSRYTRYIMDFPPSHEQPKTKFNLPNLVLDICPTHLFDWQTRLIPHSLHSFCSGLYCELLSSRLQSKDVLTLQNIHPSKVRSIKMKWPITL